MQNKQTKLILLLVAALGLTIAFFWFKKPTEPIQSLVDNSVTTSTNTGSSVTKQITTTTTAPAQPSSTSTASTARPATNAPKTTPKPTSTPSTQPVSSSTPTPTPAPVASAAGTYLGGCSVFPTSNPWNQDISGLAVHPNSETYISSIGRSNKLHPDFGENSSYGIPYNIVSASQAMVPITFTDYGDESDPGPYPIPANAKIEGGGDLHVLVLQSGECKLYELFGASKNNRGGWNAASGAVFDLRSNALRPEGWTSTDAAGLPVLAGLVRYDEVAAGKITHAIRFTAPRTQNGYIHPATHQAGSNNSALPPMGLRLRLKANFDISSFTGQAKVIAEAMKKYGIILADNGSAWYFQGAPDSRWNDDDLNQLKQITGNSFEAVNTGVIIKN